MRIKLPLCSLAIFIMLLLFASFKAHSQVKISGVIKDEKNELLSGVTINEKGMMVHGSGPLLVGADNIASWLKHTSKPFGVFGVTLEKPNQYHQDILKKAAFIYTRETLSIRDLKKVDIEGPHVQFAPDATFYINIHNKEIADEFLKKEGLENKKLSVLFHGCVIHLIINLIQTTMDGARPR